MTDAAQKGRMVYGERHPGHKLTTADVKFIRAASAGGATGRSIALRFGVSENAISQILRGVTRKRE